VLLGEVSAIASRTPTFCILVCKTGYSPTFASTVSLSTLQRWTLMSLLATRGGLDEDHALRMACKEERRGRGASRSLG
jgi:hypothetical protein